MILAHNSISRTSVHVGSCRLLMEQKRWSVFFCCVSCKATYYVAVSVIGSTRSSMSKIVEVYVVLLMYDDMVIDC